ncbi:hypothetical protein SIM91_44060 [Rhodococcus opacus]|uniref:hypothetical protein n=1 Tax=Rhodococcus opacus TaxID=37919 RepID=UPI001B8034ED|nr:hypothetical protein [Rhodococcus opacus]MDX5970121.1 hypothetical protein [Rhodococcus opacus]CAG7633537.1 hypothetical protein E143388_07511 [Rhodococcus opacus]
MLEYEIHPVRTPSRPADPPPRQRTTRPDRSPTVTTGRCGAVRRTPVDADPDSEPDDEDPRESSSHPDDPIIWPEPSPLADWWDQVLGRSSTT